MENILRSRRPLFRPAHGHKLQLRGEQGRDPYDGLRPWSAITHGAGIVLGIPAAVFLLVRAARIGGGLRVTVVAVYCAAMLALYTASTLYHSVNTSVKGRIALRRFDHASICLLIAGSYTPICLLALRGTLGWTLFGLIWAMAAAGIVLALVWIMAPRWLTAGVYLVMGWLAVFAIRPLARVMPPRGMALLLAGGVLYTVGGVLYALKWPGRDEPRFGCHEIFHLFILAGSVCHFLLMAQVVVFL